jgi:hypothetical protein
LSERKRSVTTANRILTAGIVAVSHDTVPSYLRGQII